LIDLPPSLPTGPFRHAIPFSRASTLGALSNFFFHIEIPKTFDSSPLISP